MVLFDTLQALTRRFLEYSYNTLGTKEKVNNQHFWITKKFPASTSLDAFIIRFSLQSSPRNFISFPFHATLEWLWCDLMTLFTSFLLVEFVSLYEFFCVMISVKNCSVGKKISVWTQHVLRELYGISISDQRKCRFWESWVEFIFSLHGWYECWVWVAKGRLKFNCN